MRPGLRRFVRTAHITFSVGWLGALAGFLALAITGLRSDNATIVSAVYIAMDLITKYVIVPLSVTPLLITGPLLSLGTIQVLLGHHKTLDQHHFHHHSPGAHTANKLPGERRCGRNHVTRRPQPASQMVFASAAGLLALPVATGVAVFKPRGMTVHGWRKQYHEHRIAPEENCVN